MHISHTKYIRSLGLLGAATILCGFAMGRFTAVPEIEIETKIEKVLQPAQIVRQFIPTNAERECLAKAIYAEARSESDEGQLAVGSSINNRVADSRYPNTFCGVVQYKTVRKGVTTYHFSYQDKNDPNFYHTARVFANMHVTALEIDAREKAYEAADKIILDGVNVLPKDSMNYHSTKVKPDWSEKLTFHKQIGEHIFYKGF